MVAVATSAPPSAIHSEYMKTLAHFGAKREKHLNAAAKLPTKTKSERILRSRIERAMQKNDCPRPNPYKRTNSRGNISPEEVRMKAQPDLYVSSGEQYESAIKRAYEPPKLKPQTSFQSEATDRLKNKPLEQNEEITKFSNASSGVRIVGQKIGGQTSITEMMMRTPLKSPETVSKAVYKEHNMRVNAKQSNDVDILQQTEPNPIPNHDNESLVATNLAVDSNNKPDITISPNETTKVQEIQQHPIVVNQKIPTENDVQTIESTVNLKPTSPQNETSIKLEAKPMVTEPKMPTQIPLPVTRQLNEYERAYQRQFIHTPKLFQISQMVGQILDNTYRYNNADLSEKIMQIESNIPTEPKVQIDPSKEQIPAEGSLKQIAEYNDMQQKFIENQLRAISESLRKIVNTLANTVRNASDDVMESKTPSMSAASQGTVENCNSVEQTTTPISIGQYRFSNNSAMKHDAESTETKSKDLLQIGPGSISMTEKPPDKYVKSLAVNDLATDRATLNDETKSREFIMKLWHKHENLYENDDTKDTSDATKVQTKQHTKIENQKNSTFSGTTNPTTQRAEVLAITNPTPKPDRNEAEVLLEIENLSKRGLRRKAISSTRINMKEYSNSLQSYNTKKIRGVSSDQWNSTSNRLHKRIARRMEATTDVNGNSDFSRSKLGKDAVLTMKLLQQVPLELQMVYQQFYNTDLATEDDVSPIEQQIMPVDKQLYNTTASLPDVVKTSASAAALPAKERSTDTSSADQLNTISSSTPTLRSIRTRNAVQTQEGIIPTKTLPRKTPPILPANRYRSLFSAKPKDIANTLQSNPKPQIKLTYDKPEIQAIRLQTRNEAAVVATCTKTKPMKLGSIKYKPNIPIQILQSPTDPVKLRLNNKSTIAPSSNNKPGSKAIFSSIHRTDNNTNSGHNGRQASTASTSGPRCGGGGGNKNSGGDDEKGKICKMVCGPAGIKAGEKSLAVGTSPEEKAIVCKLVCIAKYKPKN